MGAYLVIASRDARDNANTTSLLEQVRVMLDHGAEVDLYLMEAGVLLGTKTSPALSPLLATWPSLRVWADAFSLHLRGLRPSELRSGVEISDVDRLVTMISEEGKKTLWHA